MPYFYRKVRKEIKLSRVFFKRGKKQVQEFYAERTFNRDQLLVPMDIASYDVSRDISYPKPGVYFIGKEQIVINHVQYNQHERTFTITFKTLEDIRNVIISYYNNSLKIEDSEVIELLKQYCELQFSKYDNKNKEVSSEFLEMAKAHLDKLEGFISIAKVGYNHLGMECIYFIRKQKGEYNIIKIHGYKLTRGNNSWVVENI